MALKNYLLDLSAKKGVTAAQLTLACLLAQKPFIVPIPGITKMNRLEENVKAAEVILTDDELKEINKLWQYNIMIFYQF